MFHEDMVPILPKIINELVFSLEEKQSVYKFAKLNKKN